MSNPLFTPPPSNGTSPVSSSPFLGAAGSPSKKNGSLPLPHMDPPSPQKVQLSWTTVDASIRTLKTFREFILLLKRVMESGPTDNMPDIELDEHVKFFEGIYQDDVRKVADRRMGIEKLALEHPLILLDFRTYLKGVFEDVTKCNLLTELEEIEQTLRKRPPLSKAKESSSTPSKEQEFPPSLAKAWQDIGFLGELQAELSSLKTNFAFLEEDEFARDMFAHQYCQNAAIEFMQRFKNFEMNSAKALDAKKDWQKKELVSVTKAVEAAYVSLKKDIEATTMSEAVRKAHATIEEITGKEEIGSTDQEALEKAYELIRKGTEEKRFLPSLCDLDNCELSDRVTVISKEFESSHPSHEQVNVFRSLYQRIQALKAVVEIEGKCEKLRGDDRNCLHQLRVKEIAELKAEVEKLQIGTTMATIQELMDKAKKASHDITTMFGRVQETLTLFDSVVIKSETATASEIK